MATKTALKEPKGRLVNHVYERLRRKVIALELKPGLPADVHLPPRHE